MNRKQRFRNMWDMKNIRQSENMMLCMYFSMIDIRYEKSLTITNM